MPSLQDLITAAFGGQTPATQQAQQQMAQRDPSQDKSGQIITPAGLVPNMMTALQALHPDQPRYIDGQQVMGGMAMPWGGQTQKFTPEQLEQRINERNLVYHNTYPENAENILKSGNLGFHDTSVSRVPKIASFNRPVTFAIDASKMPKTTPIAEGGYAKVFNTFQPNSPMNPYFEYENRTQGKPIPLSAINRVIVNASNSGHPDSIYNNMNRALAGKTIGLEQSTMPAIHADRATLLDSDIRNRIVAATKPKSRTIQDAIKAHLGEQPAPDQSSPVPDKSQSNDPSKVGYYLKPLNLGDIKKGLSSEDSATDYYPKPSTIATMLYGHGIEHDYIDGKLHAQFPGVDKNGAKFIDTQDTSRWTIKDLKKALGY